MPIQLFYVDAFAAAPFTGNPAAICLLGEEQRDASWMQTVAREMNLSETAFVERVGDELTIRWFTPTAEVDLCGHATLASAHALWESGSVPAEQSIRFTSASGLLLARRVDAWIELDFPSRPPVAEVPPSGLLAAVGVDEARFFGRSPDGDFLIVVEQEDQVRALRPDFRRLAAFGARGVMVSARARTTAGADFISRFFAPGVGIDEDPVTGSAHCCLAPFWADRLDRQVLTGFQASARGGWVRVRLSGDRVLLGGQAQTIARGELLV
ncbi:MAG: PhzF family phenazine biosynthesis protein [Myxococcales bacterium]|nr:PhzF family phenazine biosynthesis protein [Myxococcales bacterium]MCB9704580.1 PhzF family phenazine biosynthesis protein [Myxococcales bacterium]